MGQFLLLIAIIALTLASIAYAAERGAERLGGKRPTLQLLPGDIAYKSPSGNVHVYVPITTSIVLSIVLTLVLRWLS